MSPLPPIPHKLKTLNMSKEICNQLLALNADKITKPIAVTEDSLFLFDGKQKSLNFLFYNVTGGENDKDKLGEDIGTKEVLQIFGDLEITEILTETEDTTGEVRISGFKIKDSYTESVEESPHKRLIRLITEKSLRFPTSVRPMILDPLEDPGAPNVLPRIVSEKVTAISLDDTTVPLPVPDIAGTNDQCMASFEAVEDMKRSGNYRYTSEDLSIYSDEHAAALQPEDQTRDNTFRDLLQKGLRAFTGGSKLTGFDDCINEAVNNSKNLTELILSYMATMSNMHIKELSTNGTHQRDTLYGNVRDERQEYFIVKDELDNGDIECITFRQLYNRCSAAALAESSRATEAAYELDASGVDLSFSDVGLVKIASCPFSHSMVTLLGATARGLIDAEYDPTLLDVMITQSDHDGKLLLDVSGDYLYDNSEQDFVNEFETLYPVTSIGNLLQILPSDQWTKWYQVNNPNSLIPVDYKDQLNDVYYNVWKNGSEDRQWLPEQLLIQTGTVTFAVSRDPALTVQGITTSESTEPREFFRGDGQVLNTFALCYAFGPTKKKSGFTHFPEEDTRTTGQVSVSFQQFFARLLEEITDGQFFIDFPTLVFREEETGFIEIPRSASEQVVLMSTNHNTKELPLIPRDQLNIYGNVPS